MRKKGRGERNEGRKGGGRESCKGTDTREEAKMRPRTRGGRDKGGEEGKEKERNRSKARDTLSEFKADIVTMFRFCHRVHNTRYRIRGHTSVHMQLDRLWRRFAVILRTACKRGETQHVALLPSYYLRYFLSIFLLIKIHISASFLSAFELCLLYITLDKVT